MENHPTHCTSATKNQALKSKSRQISSLVNLDSLTSLNSQPIPRQITITPFFALWIKSDHARTPGAATNSLSTTILTACFAQVGTERESTVGLTADAAPSYPSTEPYIHCLVSRFKQTQSGQHTNPQKPKVNISQQHGPLPLQAFLDIPFAPSPQSPITPLFPLTHGRPFFSHRLDSQTLDLLSPHTLDVPDTQTLHTLNNSPDSLSTYSPTDLLDARSLTPLNPLDSCSFAPLCPPRAQNFDSLEDLIPDPLDPLDAQTHNPLQTQTSDTLDKLEAQTPQPPTLHSTHTSSSLPAQDLHLVEAHPLDAPDASTPFSISPNTQNKQTPTSPSRLPQSFGLPRRRLYQKNLNSRTWPPGRAHEF